jgi:hypothetical protein
MSQTLREYLIGLGFKLDEQSYKKFNEGILKSAKNVSELGTGAVGAATAIGYAVEKIARQFEDLYYSSQRTGSAVVQLKGYEYGARQVGVSAEAARSSVEGMAAAIRTNPGLAGLLRGMGLDPSNAQQSVVGIVGKMKATFGEGGYFVAQNMAGMFGIAEGTFRQMWMNYDRLKEAEIDHARRAREAGVETKETTAKFLDFSRAMNKLEDNFSIFGQRIAQDWVGPAGEVVKIVDDMTQAFNKADLASGGLLGKIVSLASTVAGSAAALALVARIFGIKGTGGLTGKLLFGGGVLGTGLGVVQGLKSDSENGNPLRSGLRSFFGISDPHEPAPWQQGGSFDHKSQAMAFFQQQGWSKQASAGIVANLYSESKLKANAVGDGGSAFGIGQWHADRQAAFRKKFGKDIRDSTLEEQLAFVHHELTEGSDLGARRAGQMLKATQSAREAGEIVSRLYERPADTFGAANSRGRLAETYLSADIAPAGGTGGVNITQKTDVHVAAGPTALATGSAVADAQNRVNGDLVRNTAGAFR